MDLVVYLNPSGGTDPGHMVVGQEGSTSSIGYFGFRFNQLELPEEFRPPGQWRKYLFEHSVPGDIVDESEYVEVMGLRNGTGYYFKWTVCEKEITDELPPRDDWRGHARYSFNPDDFSVPGLPCFNCVTWAVEIANRIVGGFLRPVPNGRVKEMVKQLEPYV